MDAKGAEPGRKRLTYIEKLKRTQSPPVRMGRTEN
jgi:hypothetical protein